MTTGVLALQGGFARHIEMLKALGVETLEVRSPEDLGRCGALIIPGGESTAMKRQIRFAGMEEPLKTFISQNPVFGTCAGLILLSDYGFMNIQVERNAYGRQSESFSQMLEVKFPSEKKKQINGIFIRAPRIMEHSPDVEVFSAIGDHPVFVRQGQLLAASFHPELSSDTSIHEYFIKNFQL